MPDAMELASLLDAISARIEHWRADAKVISALADQVLDTREVKAERMVEVEETAGEIYREIADFDTLVAELGEVDEPNSIRMTAIADDLRLVLMEITELGTAMYSVRSDDRDENAQTQPMPPVEG